MKYNFWKNNGTSKNPLYDLLLPTSADEENIKYEIKIIIENTRNGKTKRYLWENEIKKLPDILFGILIEELKHGNSLISINNSNWPQNGSIVLKLNNRFQKESKNVLGTRWRLLNDPHYCNEEICEISGNIEHLLIN